MVPGEAHRDRVLSRAKEKKYFDAAAAIGDGLLEAYQRALVGIRATERRQPPIKPWDPIYCARDHHPRGLRAAAGRVLPAEGGARAERRDRNHLRKDGQRPPPRWSGREWHRVGTILGTVAMARCRILKGLVVRPDRFELPTFWFVAKNRLAFTDLALGTVVVNHCARLRVIKGFRPLEVAALAMLRKAAMRWVGTKIGTEKWEAEPTGIWSSVHFSLWMEGYWVRTSVKVELTKEEMRVTDELFESIQRVSPVRHRVDSFTTLSLGAQRDLTAFRAARI
jgi:hypothetical protein